jgi:hypothetical protein
LLAIHSNIIPRLYLAANLSNLPINHHSAFFNQAISSAPRRFS